MSLLKLQNISDPLLNILISNKLFIRKDLINIIGSKSCAVWFVLLNHRISRRENIEKNKSTKGLLSEISDKVVDKIWGLTKFLSKITLYYIYIACCLGL